MHLETKILIGDRIFSSSFIEREKWLNVPKEEAGLKQNEERRSVMKWIMMNAYQTIITQTSRN